MKPEQSELPEWIRSHDCFTGDRDDGYTVVCPVQQAFTIAIEALDVAAYIKTQCWCGEDSRGVESEQCVHCFMKDAIRRIRELGAPQAPKDMK